MINESRLKAGIFVFTMNRKMAIQGFQGCFHEAATKRYFGDDAESVYCSTFKQLVDIASDPSQSDGGIMAIENSIAGSILPNYMLLQSSNLRITGEIYLRIDQNLLTNHGVRLEDIKEVHSHPMALLQCAAYLEKYHWKLIATEDTALSAKYIADHKSKHIAAIAGELSAQLFDLNIIAPNIHTQQNNYTRFWVLENEDVLTENPHANKASLIFETDHSKGSLAKVLTHIADCDINLSKLQSMPIPGSDWKYSFFADCEFNHAGQLNKMMKAIQPFTANAKIYGLYVNGKNNLLK